MNHRFFPQVAWYMCNTQAHRSPGDWVTRFLLKYFHRGLNCNCMILIRQWALYFVRILLTQSFILQIVTGYDIHLKPLNKIHLQNKMKHWGASSCLVLGSFLCSFPHMMVAYAGTSRADPWSVAWHLLHLCSSLYHIHFFCNEFGFFFYSRLFFHN